MLKTKYSVFWRSQAASRVDGACASLMRHTPHLKRRTPNLKRHTPLPWGARLLARKAWFRSSFLYINGIFWFIFCILCCLKHVSWCICMVYIYVLFVWLTWCLLYIVCISIWSGYLMLNYHIVLYVFTYAFLLHMLWLVVYYIYYCFVFIVELTNQVLNL